MRDFIYITWFNNLGGFDNWLFTGYKDHLIDVVETGETTKNVFPQWPKSYGAHASTITKQTFRKARKQQVVRSQPLTYQQAQIIGEEIKTSILVQVVPPRDPMLSSLRKPNPITVIVDNQSVVIRKEKDKVHTISFTITYTDDYPAQTA